MTTLANKAILSGTDNHPPMLEKDMYDSWKSIMELYIMNRKHGRMILESVENGPLIWPTIEENGVTRPRKYSKLTVADAIQADLFKQGDDPIDAINHMMSFILAVVTSHYPTTNNQLRNSSNPRKLDDSWFKDKVLLVQAQANGQILHEEELAFLADPGTAEVALMVNLSHYGLDDLAEVHNPDNVDNDMINQEDIWYAGSDTRPPMLDRTDFESWQQRIRLYCLGKDNGENIMKSITEGPFQWERSYKHLAEYAEEQRLDSITEVKLNRGLKESNFDQLYAYLKQHEVHANENRMMMERFIQPIDDPLALVSNASNQNTSTDNLIESITNTLALLRTSSNARNNATVQDGRVVVQDVRGRYNANNQGRPFQRNNARGNVVAGNEKRATNFDDDVDDLALNVDHVFETDQCDAFDSDVDEASTTQTMFMANLSSEDPIYDEAGSSYDSNTLFEVQDHDTFVDHMDEYHEVFRHSFDQKFLPLL
ncbi:hypothetical protein Tco_0925380 [Tanacetum coccineum]|uniref:Integrase, catalytic region, zinc finger, CCHC-type, peptidase aspartic, catalytic n=1 Tax=Tanacetum coccineum TaxID=301880 RepID=A0ABQ5D6N2_9ASTR